MEMSTTTQATLRVMIADDDADMRQLVGAVLGNDPRVDVVADAEDGAAAVRSFGESLPDVCVLDHQMPGLTGLQAAERILADRPDTKVLLFSAAMTTEITEAARVLGVRCLRKDRVMDLPDTIVAMAST